jgi:hypothetical protein
LERKSFLGEKCLRGGSGSCSEKVELVVYLPGAVDTVEKAFTPIREYFPI